ncbi:MAG: M48 family metallopeptidase [Verrucomicrobia bacterium]|nr:M48 family metallopeptidase [Verrucomicrobiota bacterium]
MAGARWRSFRPRHAAGRSSPARCRRAGRELRSRCGHQGVSRHRARRQAGQVGRLLRGHLLAAALEFPALLRHLAAAAADALVGPAAGLGGRKEPGAFLQIVLYGLGYVCLTWLLSFPLTAYEEYFREHQYGLATQTFGPWMLDQLKGLAVALIVTPLGLALLYAVFRRAQRAWWVAGSLVTVALLATGLLIAPVFIEPLFNKYTPVSDPAVRDPILAMARANQIPVDQVLQFDASRQTNRVSANVSGFLGTTRIALNDNLLRRCSLPEVRMVMAHEMGHYVLNHIGKFLVFFGVMLVAGFWFCDRFFELIRTRFPHWGVRGIDDPAGFPLLMLLLGVFFFVVTPIKNTIIRSSEAEADAFGLNVSREPDGFAQCALKLGDYRKLDPGPWEEIFFFDHPSGRARIRMAMDWKAEQLRGRQ